MFKTHFINGNPIEKHLFRRYSNILTKINALSKKQHFYTEFAKNKTNARKTWDIIRSVLPNKSKREPLVPLKLMVQPRKIQLLLLMNLITSFVLLDQI